MTSPARTGTGSKLTKQRIGIIGAGFAGISSAKILADFGFDTVVFEKDPEVGGVWASSRRYPGLKTQNVRSTYSFSDFPYPKGTPEWPSGQQVQNYISSYCSHFNLKGRIHLNTTVESALLNEGSNMWTLRVYHTTLGARNEIFDFLIVANGVFSDPLVPLYKGAEEFTRSGGRIVHTIDCHEVSDLKDKDVVVIGYGKSACDLAIATVEFSARTTVVANHLIWKVPEKIGCILNYKWLLLTRLGEALFPYIELKGFERFLHGFGKKIPFHIFRLLEKIISSQHGLKKLGLKPSLPIETIACSTISLATNGFYQAVKEGRLHVEAGVEVTHLKAGKVFLSNGDVLGADCIICGTGFRQSLPFFNEKIQRRLIDERGNFRLHRLILPTDIPNLAFNGYNSSLFCPLSAEIGALWIGAYLTKQIAPPNFDECLVQINKRLEWMEKRTNGKHVRGANIVPFSMHYIDELLEDMNCQISPIIRLGEWIFPINPTNYAGIIQQVIGRSSSKTATKPSKTSAPWLLVLILPLILWLVSIYVTHRTS